MEIVKQPTLDLLDVNAPKLNTTSDVPVIETKPDATPDKVVPDAEKQEPSTPTEDSSAAPDEAKKPAKGVQKRIDELTRQREDERRAREAAEARELRILAALERSQGIRPKDAPVEDVDPVKPLKTAFENPEDYDNAIEEYVVNKAAYIARKEAKAQREEEKKRQETEKVQAQAKAAQEAFQTRVQKAKEKYADFSEIAENPNIQVSMPMVYAISSYEQGPEIQYYLGKNPAEAERIRNLTTRDPVSGESVPDAARQLVELGKIAYKLENPATAVVPAKPVSAAPAPIKPIGKGETHEKSPEEMTMDEYAAYRKPQLFRRPGERY